MMNGLKSGVKELKRPTKSSFAGRLPILFWNAVWDINGLLASPFSVVLSYIEEANIGLYVSE